VEVLYNLATLTEASWKVNEQILDGLHVWFKRAVFLLAVQVVVWAVIAL
jgi:hypothetical protein